MAARKQKPKPRGASRTRSAPAKKPVPGWIWLGSGLVIGGFLVFLSQLKPGSDEVKRAPAGKPESAASQPAKPATPPRPKYEFYEELTKARPCSKDAPRRRAWWSRRPRHRRQPHRPRPPRH